jgi:hypothetical protein
MALARCVLGKVLGVGCRFFPTLLDVPTFSARFFTSNDLRDLLQRKVEHFVGEKCSEKVGLESELNLILGILYMPHICDMGQTALLPLRRKAC